MTITELVKKYDPENQFEVLKNSYQQIKYAKNNKYDLEKIDTSKIKNIIVTGLGGSAISGDLMLNFLQNEITLPIQVNRNYSLPNYADSSTLLLASSYSGNTEETISVLNEARDSSRSIWTPMSRAAITRPTSPPPPTRRWRSMRSPQPMVDRRPSAVMTGKHCVPSASSSWPRAP